MHYPRLRLDSMRSKNRCRLRSLVRKRHRRLCLPHCSRLRCRLLLPVRLRSSLRSDRFRSRRVRRFSRDRSSAPCTRVLRLRTCCRVRFPVARYRRLAQVRCRSGLRQTRRPAALVPLCSVSSCRSPSEGGGRRPFDALCAASLLSLLYFRCPFRSVLFYWLRFRSGKRQFPPGIIRCGRRSAKR